MRHAALCAIVHNLADSLGSGASFITEQYHLDVYGDASASQGKILRVDFLAGLVLEGDADEMLLAAVRRMPEALDDMCFAAGGSWDELRLAQAIFSGSGSSVGFTLLIEDITGRRSKIDYVGSPAQRVKVVDGQGRLRPKSSRA